jgi:hypothetical protein
MKRALIVVVLFALGWAGVRGFRRWHTRDLPSANAPRAWDAAAAARYLDSRVSWWQSWPDARREQGTVCISCHTVLPYALARPALRETLDEKGRAPQENLMLTSVEKRVADWKRMAPYYTDAVYGPGMSADSRATESVLNAIVLARYKASPGGEGAQETGAALDDAWALEKKSGDDAGGWGWQDFHLAPWEAPESAYQGAALFAVALGDLPANYTVDKSAAEHVQRLREYLRRGYSSQPPMSQAYVLWASARMPGLLDARERQTLIARLGNLQMPDGGWSLVTLDRQPGIKRYLRTEWQLLAGKLPSDGCATGLVVLALEKAGANPGSPAVRRGLTWLIQHQKPDGSWWAPSLNGLDRTDSDVSRFMDDAATGYAVLALEAAHAKTSEPREADQRAMSTHGY